MPGYPVPQRTDMTGPATRAAAPRARRALGGAAVALVALSFATAIPVRAASVLSDGSASPTTGTTATAFTFSVHYTSSDPPRPAQAVHAAMGNATVPLTKVSGTALDGTWQGTSTLPAGTWQVTFHAESAGEPPQPLLGPTVTVTAPPPTPQPTPPPPPPPPPTAAPTPVPTQLPAPTGSPAPPRPDPQPTPPPTDADDSTAAPSRSLVAGASGSAQETAPPSAAPSSPAGADTSPGERVASLLIVGGAMSLGGAAVLARQWHVTRQGRSRSGAHELREQHGEKPFRG
jgi:hypothetical protein